MIAAGRPAPAKFDRLVREGLALRAAGNVSGAIERLRAARELRPRHAGACVELGLSLRLAGDLGPAREAFEAALRFQPSNARAYTGLGQVCRSLGDRGGALAAFERAAGLGSARARIELAVESLANGDPAAAASFYESILAESPGDFDAGLGLAQLQAMALQFEACIERCDVLIRNDPARLAPVRLKCMALIRLDRGDEALRLAAGLDADAAGRFEVDAVRLEVCRAASRRQEALDLLLRWQAATDRTFAYWTQGLLTLLAFFELPAAEAALRDPPARLPQEWARVRQFEAMLADLQWRTGDAIVAFERSLADGRAAGGSQQSGSHQSLARLYFLQADAVAATRHLERRLALDAGALVLQGASRRSSQSLLGQLINELRLDGVLAGRLARVAVRAPASRVARLLALVRANPGSTPAAIGLLLALRQRGTFGHALWQAAATPAEARIPRRIVQYWDQPRPPESIESLMRGWAEAHPGYAHQCFDDAAARAFLERHFPPEVLRAYARAAHPAQASDLFRLAALFALGGFYVDADDRCVGHLSAVTDPAAGLVVYQEEYATLGNNFMGCVAGEPLIGQALRDAVGALLRGDADLLWLATGPGLLTRVFAAALAARGAAWPQMLVGRRILDRSAIAVVVRPHTLLNYKHFERSWSQGMARRI